MKKMAQIFAIHTSPSFTQEKPEAFNHAWAQKPRE
jgi:hypothetical protein